MTFASEIILPDCSGEIGVSTLYFTLRNRHPELLTGLLCGRRCVISVVLFGLHKIVHPIFKNQEIKK